MAVPVVNASLVPSPQGGWWIVSLLSAFISLLLLRLPGGRRRCAAALGLGFVCLLTFALGCGGGSSFTAGGGGGGGGRGGAGGGSTAVPTTVTVTASATKVASGTTITFTADVKSTKPVTGSVFINDAGGGFLVLQLTNGSGQTQTNNLLVGTHVISAQYQGDANNLPSQSGTLNIVVTGTTTQPVMGQTSVDTHLIFVNVTIQ